MKAKKSATILDIEELSKKRSNDWDSCIHFSGDADGSLVIKYSATKKEYEVVYTCIFIKIEASGPTIVGSMDEMQRGIKLALAQEIEFVSALRSVLSVVKGINK